MSAPSIARKFAPPAGRMPTLQFCRPEELRIDPSYQRDVNNGASQVLIRRIAAHWNWDLCQPLVVARRTDFIDRLFVIDGQHRLEAARLRGDISQLPCVIVAYDSAAGEAASFVSLNQQRRPLSKLDLFKAAVAGDSVTAIEIMNAITAAGLSLAPHGNPKFWKPGQLANIGGIEASWRKRGPASTSLALKAMAQGFSGQVLAYAGTIFPGVAAVCHDEIANAGGFGKMKWAEFIAMLGARSQADWRRDNMQAKALHARNFGDLSEIVLRLAWADHWAAVRKPGQASPDMSPPTAKVASAPVQVAPPAPAKPAPTPLGGWRPKTPISIAKPVPRVSFDQDGRAWCSQCDMSVARAKAAACTSKFCKVRPA